MKQGRALHRPNARTGIALVWLILMLPVLFLLLCFVVEIGNLWLARAELETALESAALAAAKEWGDAGSSSNTSTPRQVAQAFAAANTVRGQPISLVLNYNAAGVPNRNAALTGDGAQLVFGAITSTSPTVVFNASVAPGCGGGTTASTSKVLLDVSSKKFLEADDAWGINFQPPAASTPANLTIQQVVINLRPSNSSDPGLDAYFDFATTPPVISNNSPNKVALQNDVFGLSNGALTLTTVGTVKTWSNGQVAFVFNSTLPHLLTINFSPYAGDAGFEPGNRIRFGAKVAQLGTGSRADDGDGIGDTGVSATLTFAVNGVSQNPLTATFIDSNFRGNGASHPAGLNPLIASNLPYVLPLAPSNGNRKDDQSYVETQGTVTVGAGAGQFAVRAHAVQTVPAICNSLFGSFSVQADATARYDCAAGRVSVIRVDEFLGP